MARGSEAKNVITDAILTAFPGSFKYDKEIRIPVNENGEVVQIKVTLTAAKANVAVGGDSALPGEDGAAIGNAEIGTDFKITEEEIKRVALILSKLS